MKELGVKLRTFTSSFATTDFYQNLMKTVLAQDYAKIGILKTMLPIKHNKIMLTH